MISISHWGCFPFGLPDQQCFHVENIVRYGLLPHSGDYPVLYDVPDGCMSKVPVIGCVGKLNGNDCKKCL